MVSMVLLLLLTACPAPGPECVLADEWGDQTERTVYLNPTKEWYNVNLPVAFDAPLYVKTTGAVDTCPLVAEYTQFSIRSNVGNWQDSGVEVLEDQPLAIFIDANSTYSAINGIQEAGKGLYAYIGDTAPSNDHYWYGPSGTSVNGGAANKYTSTDPHFFEMFDNGSVGSGASGYTGLAPASGKIWFKYARSPDARSVSTTGNHGERYSPWRGRYEWHDWKCASCISSNVAFLGCGYYANPICAAAFGGVIGACMAGGYLFPSNEHCQELTGDHWIEEEYSANSGGYNLTISRGCIGQNGNFLRMAIADEDQIVKVGEEPLLDQYGNQRYSPEEGYPLMRSLFAVNMPEGSPSLLNLDPDSPDADVDAYGKYDGTVPANGEVWLQFIDENIAGKGNGDYSDNVGSYRVFIKTKKVGSGFSDVVNGFVEPIEDIMRSHCKTGRHIPKEHCPAPEWKMGLAERLYKQFLGTGGAANTFVTTLRVVLVLYIVLYGMAYMLGMISDSQSDFIGRVIRFAIVQQLLSPASWEFFNLYLFRVFTEGLDELIVMLTGQFSGVTGTTLTDPLTGDPILDADGEEVVVSVMDKFGFANQTISFFFRQETMIKVSGLLFTNKVFLINPLGFVYAIVIFVGMFYYIIAVLKAAVIYLLALIAIALLLVISPVAIAFMLFEYTRDAFKGWLNQLMNFALQPTLVLTALAIFNIFVYSALYNALRYDVCWQCVWQLSISIMPMFGDIDLCLFKFYLPWGIGGTNYTPVGLFTILIFIIIAHAMLSFNDWMTKLAAQLTSGIQSTALADKASKVGQSAISSAAIVAKIGSDVAKKGAKMARKGAGDAAKGGKGGGGDDKKGAKR
jgi:type IV secretory pathway VirB6-like protein